MGAQACCTANGLSAAEEAIEDLSFPPAQEQQRVGLAAKLALGAPELQKSPAPGDAEACASSEARWSESSTAAQSSAASAAGDVCSSTAEPVEEEDKEEVAAEDEAPAVATAAVYDTSCATITFEPKGPRGMGLLTVTFKHVSISADSFGEALVALGKATREHIHADFATLFDISKLVVPSPFVLPKLLSGLKENLVHLESWREYQQAFAIVQGNSTMFNAIVSAFGALSRAKNKPIFAKTEADALRQLSEAPCV